MEFLERNPKQKRVQCFNFLNPRFFEGFLLYFISMIERIQPVRGKQETKQELILNHFNGLFKDNATITQNLFTGGKELFLKDSQEIRREQLGLYKKFVKDVLHVDIDENSDQDPFFKVAKTPLQQVYIDKHDMINTSHFDRDYILLPSTMILSGNYLAETNENNNIKHENIRLSFDLFDPVVINSKRDWIMHFGFLNLEDRSNAKLRRVLAEGCIVLEPEVVEIMKEVMNEEEKNQFEKKIQEVKTWFNHDMTAHGTYLPRINSDDEILSVTNNNQKELFRKEFLDDSYNSAFAGELWSLNLHHSIFKEFIKERPSIMRYFATHMNGYINLVDQITEKINNKEFAMDCKQYLLKVYAFSYFRLIDPTIYKTDPLFNDINSNYPDLPNLGSEEESIRKYIFSEPGLYDSINKEYIPHEKIFSDFTELFKNVPEMTAIKDKAVSFFKGDSNEVLDNNEKEKLIAYIFNSESGRSFLTNYIPTKEFNKKIKNIQLNDLLSRPSDVRKIIEIMLADNDHSHLFEKAYKVCYGFKNLKTGKKSHLQNRSMWY
jgi:hypothetical protein